MRSPGWTTITSSTRRAADLLRRLERNDDAARAYETALALTTNEAERRFLTRRLREVGTEA